ncbi:MAG TPA: 50S ribosomal protein L11 methyltransferase [Stellaceae bacterium]|nr:50S ribosomal protein L11 methyltransferase [Stellaceae bacterium]
MTDYALFVRHNTAVARPPLVPEIALHLATEVTPIWQATEDSLARGAVPPPFWAFAWAGGQALARYLIDNPGLVGGREVLDIGSGSGIVAIAAAKAGARVVTAAEIDPFAAAAIALNAELNGVLLRLETRNLLDRAAAGWGVALAGDICYEEPMASRAVALLRRIAARPGRLALLGDPGRAYLPREGLIERARYLVPTSRELEDREGREGVVWEVLAE